MLHRRQSFLASFHWIRLDLTLAIIGLIGVLIGFGAWAMSSPVAGAPDDDYHLSSIWCPRPLENSGCQLKVKNGTVSSVEVPQSVAKSAGCVAFRANESAACIEQFSDTRKVPSTRFDDGGYPWGYYQFHHLFVGPDVHRSVVVMRMANILIAVGGLLGVSLLTSPQVRHRLLIATTVAWIPMGIYFIASNNPSSWAISGCMIYASAIVGSLEAHGHRRTWLLVFAALGAFLAAASRGDSAFYIFVISIATCVLVRRGRQQIPTVLVATVAALGGLASFLSTGQATNLGSSGGWPVDTESSLLHVFRMNVNSLPEYLSSFWGSVYGPGWGEIPLPTWVTLGMIFLTGGVILVGAQEVGWRKLASSTVILGAILGIPAVTMTIRRVHPLTNYQGRYMLPLLAVLLLFWLAQNRVHSLLTSTGQVILFWAIAVGANTLSLRRVVTRYAVGVDSSWAGGLDSPAWWPWGLSAKALIATGSAAFAIGLSALLLISVRSISNSAGTQSGRALARRSNSANESDRYVNSGHYDRSASHVQGKSDESGSVSGLSST